MKRDFYNYLIGLSQAASAALLASAVIVPEARLEATIGCLISAFWGALFVFLKHRED